MFVHGGNVADPGSEVKGVVVSDLLHVPDKSDEPDVDRLLENLKQAVAKSRATQLSVTERALLEDWARYLFPFLAETPFLVGSVLERPDYRDIDVRVILEDDRYAQLCELVDIERLGLLVSLWGQKVTGLPIDFQIQQMTAANDQFKSRRHALGIKS